MNTKQIGYDAENKASEYLQSNGYAIIERNYRIREGEIDIIALKDGTISFVEVKKLPETWEDIDISSKITMQKIRKIKRTASVYLFEHKKIRYNSISFDVAAVKNSTVTYYCGAF